MHKAEIGEGESEPVLIVIWNWCYLYPSVIHCWQNGIGKRVRLEPRDPFNLTTEEILQHFHEHF